jgi:cobalt-zinc-cadmium efflux system protein
MSQHNLPHQHGTGNIRFAFFLNLGFTIIEFIGGILTNSVAILADAVHDLGDSVSLGIAWYLQKYAQRGSSQHYTYGYKRFSLLGALINSLILILGSFYVLSETIPRLLHPQPINEKGMFLLAILGVIVNGAAVLRLKKGTSINEKVVTLHLMEDVLGWAAILVGSVLMYFFDLPFIDPLLSVLISIYILVHVVGSIRQSLKIILQGTPDNIDMTHIRQRLLAHPFVSTIHDVHVWTTDGNYHVMTLHVVLDAATADTVQVKDELRQLLKEENIEHATIEFENPGESCCYEQCAH